MPKATTPVPLVPQPAEAGPAIPWPQRQERPRVLDYLAQLEQSAIAGVVVAKRPS
jgi:hypothetical protein